MAVLDALTRSSRRWSKISKESTEAIYRAAQHQARLHKISDVSEEARRLAKLYSLEAYRPRWQEFGELAFHLVVAYPPDLAYLILYGLRSAIPGLTYDPVPLTLKALEEMYSFQPSSAKCGLEAQLVNSDEYRQANRRAEKAAQILAREVSTAPLRYASGIWNLTNPTTKPFMQAAIAHYNPRGAELLSRATNSWLLTPTGLIRSLLELLFGKDKP